VKLRSWGDRGALLEIAHVSVSGMRLRSTLVPLLLLAACRNTPSSSTSKGAAPVPFPSDAPPRDACRTHDDCTVMVWDGPQPPDPCCDARVGYLPVSRGYLEFMAAYRKEHCALVSCPPSPLPGAEPNCCAGHARCVDNHCVSACDDPRAQLPAVSVLDPACRDPLPPSAGGGPN